MPANIQIGHLIVPPHRSGPVPPGQPDLLVYTHLGSCTYQNPKISMAVGPGDVLLVPRSLREVHWVNGAQMWEPFWFFAPLDTGRLRLLTGRPKPVSFHRWSSTGLTRVRIETAFRRLTQLQGLKPESAVALRQALVDVILAELRLHAAR